MSRFVCTYDGEYDERLIASLTEALKIQPLAARALIRKGYADAGEAKRFLNPAQQPLCDPYVMPDMLPAVKRLNKAFAGGESICIYGDYDADGICAAAILLDCFRGMTEHVMAYIPSRHGEGYGLNEAAVRTLAEKGVQLIVTVDNGISAHEEIALCRDLGMDVIVTDHHSRPERLPDCCALVTPPDGACGAGVALRLARAIAGDERLERWLPLAAVATVADVVPLTGDNRRMVARGLPLIEENIGLGALLRIAGKGESAVDAGTLAFMLAPRLNAAGRLGDAMRGVRLLLSDDLYTAERLAAELNDANTQRRSIEADILAQAEDMLRAAGDGSHRAILLRRSGWNVGVIGIVASRLSEKYCRPAILFNEDEKGMITGSGRSVGRIDLYAALSACQKRFLHFGGHAGAAGVTMESAEFPAFSEEFEQYLSVHYDDEDFIPQESYDESIALGELTLSAVSELSLLAPFGEGNPEPVFRLCGIRLAEVKSMGQGGRHVSARATQGGNSLRLVGFGFGDRLAELRAQADSGCTLLVRPSVHSFRGMDSVELMLEDFMPDEKLFDDFFMNLLYNGACVEDCAALRRYADGEMALDAASMRRMYSGLRDGIGMDGCRTDALCSRFARAELCALLVFLELGFFKLGEDIIWAVPNADRRELSDSRIYRWLRTNDEREEPLWT